MTEDMYKGYPWEGMTDAEIEAAEYAHYLEQSVCVWEYL